jgi:hypothetical protein
MGLQRDTFLRLAIKNIIQIVWENVEKYALNNLMATLVQQYTIAFSFICSFVSGMLACN